MERGNTVIQKHTVEELQRLSGGIVGSVEIVDYVKKSTSPWFHGKYGFVLKNARPLPFIPYPGQLSLFEVPDGVIATSI